MAEKKYTINDVANEAGVSNATVSLVLSGKGKISDEKRKIVLETIDRLGYKRQRNHSSSKVQEKKVIGLIAYCDFPFQWWFVSGFISEIEKRLYSQGYYLLIFKCNQNTDQQDLYEKIINAGLHGIIALQYNNNEFLRKIISHNIPLVLLNNSNFQNDFNTVCSDDFQGAYEGTKKLIKSGHKQITYIDYPRPSQPSTVTDRYFGFRKALEEANISFTKQNHIQVDLNDEAELESAIQRNLVENKTTAIFVHDDYFAVRVLRCLENQKKSIPEDISIVAPGDSLPYDEPFIPQISTMQINRESMGKLSVDMLLSVIKVPNRPKQVVKTIEDFKDRGSCITLKSSK